MKTPLQLSALLFLLLPLCLVACGITGSKAVPEAGLYLCGCETCQCETVSKEPGKCSCGKAEMQGVHVLKVEGSTALVCACSAECECEMQEGETCGCGEKVRRVNLAGKGYYTCGCDGDCACTPLAMAPGTCGCGKELKKIE